MNPFDIYLQTHHWCLERGIPVTASTETGSTNDDAKVTALEVTAPLKIHITAKQNHGRGRGKNKWNNCKAGTQLLTTWVYELKNPPQHLTGPLVGLALCESLSSIWPQTSFGIKPPNDIYVEKHKLCGILIETLSGPGRHKILIGFGLNVFSHPEDLATSTHLNKHATVTATNWKEFLNVLAVQLNDAVQKSSKTHLDPQECNRLCDFVNQSHMWPRNVDQVLNDGSFVCGGERIDWRDL